MTPKKFHYSKSYSIEPDFEAFSDRHYLFGSALISSDTALKSPPYAILANTGNK